MRIFTLFFLAGLLFFGVPSQLLAQNKVVVVPLIGSGAEIKPIPVNRVINRRMFFTNIGDRGSITIGPVPVGQALVIRSITVMPETYGTSNAPIQIRYCRYSVTNVSRGCSHSVSAPNNTTTTIDYGIGEILVGDGNRRTLDLTSRGGIPTGVANQIVLFVSGYIIDL